MYYQYCFGQRTKAQPHGIYSKENELYPSPDWCTFEMFHKKQMAESFLLSSSKFKNKITIKSFE